METLIQYKCGHTQSYLSGTPQIMDDYKQKAKSELCPACDEQAAEERATFEDPQAQGPGQRR